jgi:hypothetical protein
VFHLSFGLCRANQSINQLVTQTTTLLIPQVYVKSSAFFRVSKQTYPYQDAVAALRLLVDTFGANRVVWGTDWPWVTEQCGYLKAWSILDDAPAAAQQAGGSSGGSGSASSVLTAEEREWVMGGTLQSLFPGAWGGEAA